MSVCSGNLTLGLHLTKSPTFLIALVKPQYGKLPDRYTRQLETACQMRNLAAFCAFLGASYDQQTWNLQQLFHQCSNYAALQLLG